MLYGMFPNLVFECPLGRLKSPSGGSNVLPHFCLLNLVFHLFLQNEHLAIFHSHFLNLNNTKYIHTSRIINSKVA